MSQHPQISPVEPRPRSGATSPAGRVNANPAHWSTAAIAEMAIAVALAAALGLVKLFVMPQGGSVSLEMLPILFIAVRRGLVPAVTVGVVYGFVQLLLPGAFLVQPVQVLLDYPLAFGALGLAALVPVPVSPVRLNWREIRPAPARVVPFLALLSGAVVLGVSARFVCHFLSGIIFFGSYAPAGQAVWIYSLTYNLLYLAPEAVLTVVLLALLTVAYDEAGVARGGRSLP
ncbi:MAG TPA: energy-coupled thiamine transporter ThiT [Thermoleophilia bacterium]|nr:energy-coupled thiamine transporter ThiT [Thermoleophilia bacterium]